MDFNKRILMNNIYYLIKENNLKIGDIENSIGVSAGYISRLNKSSNDTIPSVEFLTALSERLSVSLDLLTKCDYSECSKIERFIIQFIEKLRDETLLENLIWEREKLEEVTTGYTKNPLFVYPFNSKELKYDSLFYKENYVLPVESIYKTSLPSAEIVYLSKIEFFDNEKAFIPFEGTVGYELYLFDGLNTKPVCPGLKVPSSRFYTLLKDLYGDITTSLTHFKLSEEARISMYDFIHKDDIPF